MDTEIPKVTVRGRVSSLHFQYNGHGEAYGYAVIDTEGGPVSLYAGGGAGGAEASLLETGATVTVTGTPLIAIESVETGGTGVTDALDLR